MTTSLFLKLFHFFKHDNVFLILLMGLRGSTLIIKFVLMLYIAKVMGVEALGVFGLITAASIVVPVVVGLSLMYAQTRKAVWQPLETTTNALKHFSKFLIGIYSLIVMAAVLYGLYSGDVIFSLLVVGVVFFEHINATLYALLLNLSKPFVANVLHFLRAGFWPVMFILICYIIPEYQNLNTLLLFWIFGGILSLVAFFIVSYDWPWSVKDSDNGFLVWLSNEFKESRTMYYNGIANSSAQYLNHFLVAIILGIEATGVYVFFMQVLSAMGNLIQSGVIQIFRPKLVNAAKAISADFNLLYKKCLKITLYFSTFLSLIAIPMVYFLAVYFVKNPLIVENYLLFIGGIVFFILNIMRNVNELVFYSQHNDKAIFYQSIVAIIAGFIISLPLIFLLGLWGAIIGSIILTIIILLIQCVSLRRDRKA